MPMPRSIAGAVFLIGATAASAAQTVADAAITRDFPLAQIFTFLFLMLGPFKIIGPFSRITKGADVAFTRRIAVRATLFASLALALAATLGERFLSSYGIPLPVLALSAGLILLLVALHGTLQQFAPQDAPAAQATDSMPPPTMAMALTPLAFPTIVTPYGIAALVVFMAYSPDLQARLIIGAVLAVIMLLNLVVMLATRRLLPFLGVALPVVGAVLGVVQVALGLQIIQNSLKALGAT